MDKRFIIYFLIVLVAVVTGCGGAHRYDSRLVAVDSLLQVNPDSALALVEAISPDSLANDGDRAYRDLLVTQARYKCYITATSDSDINHALDYYRHHSGDREKLTRAYIYKGAVMEELNHPDSAMFYYKTAEATAAPDDYANLGYANLRIADLYRMNYADPENCFEKYKSALHFFTLTRNKRLQQNCLFNMGGYCAITKNEDSERYLSLARQLAQELNDSLEFYKCQELICRQLLQNDTTLSQAKQIAQDCLNNYQYYINNDIILDLADIYARSGKPDSASYFIGLVDDKINIIDIEHIKIRKYLILSKIAQKEGDTALSNHYDKKAHHVMDLIDSNKEKYRIQQIENTNNSHQVNSYKHIINSQRTLVIFLIVTSLITLLLILLMANKYYRKKRLINSIIEELELVREFANQVSSQPTPIDRHEALLEQIEAKDSIIELFVRNMVHFMQTSIDASEHDSPKRIRERINDSISHITADEEFWVTLRSFLDRNHNNIISNIAMNPKITKKDLMFIELLCCGFNYIEISITMGYVPAYISQKKNAIARKLNLDIPLQDYINNVMKGQYNI